MNTWECSGCGQLIPNSVDRCSFCGTRKSIDFDNYCINPKCTEYNVRLDDDRKVCRECGGLTKTGKVKALTSTPVHLLSSGLSLTPLS